MSGDVRPAKKQAVSLQANPCASGCDELFRAFLAGVWDSRYVSHAIAARKAHEQLLNRMNRTF